MKKTHILALMTLLCIFAFSTPAYATSQTFIEESVASNSASVTVSHELRDLPPRMASETLEQDMQSQSNPNSKAVSYTRANIMVYNETTIATEVWLINADNIMYTKLEGKATLYVNGKYVTSEDFKADPILPVYTLQAGVPLECSDGLKIGDEILVIFKGSFDTLSNGSADYNLPVTITVTEL